MKSGIFVSGTDTGVGKTVVSSLLVTAFQAHEVRTGYFKPIQTGLDLDTDSVSHLTSLPISDFPPPAYQLAPPMAPYRAALLENTEIDLDHVVQKWQDLGDQLWIVEGAGGLLVPLTEKQTTRELIQKLGLKMLLVASTRLGTLNHTLMTLEVAQAAGIEVLGMILVGEEDAAHAAVRLALLAPHQPLCLQRVERARGDDGRAVGDALQALGGGGDLGELEHGLRVCLSRARRL